MEKPRFLEGLARFYRENFGEEVFYYDPNLPVGWKENPDGSITVGKDQIKTAIEQAKLFEDHGKKIAEEKVKTAAGLSLAYIKKHFPEALNDVGYRE
jgi:hypothetical protein